MTEKPERIAEPDFSGLISECQKYIDARAIGGFADYNAVSKAALETVFGETVWMWIMDRVFEAEWEAKKDRPVRLSWLRGLEKGEEDRFITPDEFTSSNRGIEE